MKTFIRIFLTAVTVLFISCPLEKEAEGKIVVQNQSYDTGREITDVWLKEAGSMEWVNHWHGSCAGDAELIKELSFSVNPGSYDVRIKVMEVYGYGFVPYFYETGYLQSVKITAGEYKYIIYDGNGIYDMESQ
jgi:hypothetical protein